MMVLSTTIRDPREYRSQNLFDSLQPLVTISVEYSLAPKFPFPNGVIEAMSIVDYLLASNPHRKLHVTAASAGAGIALPVVLEAERTKFPGRIVR
jgi:acetyl esterase/lipase